MKLLRSFTDISVRGDDGKSAKLIGGHYVVEG